MYFSMKGVRSKDEYIIKELVGRGSFGEVEKCQHKQTSKIYAIKTIQISKLYIDSIEDEAINMLRTKSQYVLQLIDHFYDDDLGSYILVTPYFKLGSFQTLMNQNWGFDQLLLFFYQMAKGLFDLSKNSILHLDLKPENILIKAPGQYVLCDLGCSRKLQANCTASKSYNILKMSCNAKGGGTTDYASPDLILNGQMTPFTDIWSLGVILYKVIFKQHPLYKVSKTQLTKNMNQFFDGKFDIKYNIEHKPEFKPIVDIVERMLVCSNNKEKRLTWGQIIEHILKMLKLPMEKADHIVTNLDSLLFFADRASVITSAVIYYYKQVEHLVKKGFDFKPVIRNICVYLITLTKEISKQTKKGNFIEDSQFYLFETTKKHLTKKQKSCAERLEQETVEVANVHNVPVEIGSLQICRDRVVNDFGKFQQFLKGLPKPENVIEKIQLNKAIKICEFISYRNELKYENRLQLVEFVKELINS